MLFQNQCSLNTFPASLALRFSRGRRESLVTLFEHNIMLNYFKFYIIHIKFNHKLCLPTLLMCVHTGHFCKLFKGENMQLCCYDMEYIEYESDIHI